MELGPSCVLPNDLHAGLLWVTVSHRNGLAIITLVAHSDWSGLETELMSVMSPESQAYEEPVLRMAPAGV